jgi:hypothetical protein
VQTRSCTRHVCTNLQTVVSVTHQSFSHSPKPHPLARKFVFAPEFHRLATTSSTRQKFVHLPKLNQLAKTSSPHPNVGARARTSSIRQNFVDSPTLPQLTKSSSTHRKRNARQDFIRSPLQFYRGKGLPWSHYLSYWWELNLCFLL